MQIPQISYSAFCADQSGQDTIEYALVVALVALGALASVKTLASAVSNFWPQVIARFYASF